MYIIHTKNSTHTFTIHNKKTENMSVEWNFMKKGEQVKKKKKIRHKVINILNPIWVLELQIEMCKQMNQS